MKKKEKVFYYIYCDGILGVKTNIRKFRWIYGVVAPCATETEFESCAIKFSVILKKESLLKSDTTIDNKFQAFCWNDTSNTIFYRRKLISLLDLGYNVSFDNNNINVCVGSNYFRLVKYRLMNMHGIYYLLSDIANMILLKNGFLTLYASAVYYDEKQKGIVIFGAPNTGKSLTASKLCDKYKYSLLGEDVVITDCRKIFSCPWTSSYRKKSAFFDSSGAFGRVNKNCKNKIDTCELTDIVVLSLSQKNMNNDFLRQVNILNGYLFGYYSSPIVKILGYFCEEFYKPWQRISLEILKNMVDESNNFIIYANKSIDFYDKLNNHINGGN